MADLDGREIPFVMFSGVSLIFGIPKNFSPLPCDKTLTKYIYYLSPLVDPDDVRDGPKSKQH